MPIDRLPIELWELITRKLCLSDLFALRLTSKYISDKCSGPNFRFHIAGQAVVLTRKSLDSLHALAIHPTLSSAVKRVYISVCPLGARQPAPWSSEILGDVSESGLSDALAQSPAAAYLSKKIDNSLDFHREISDLSDRDAFDKLEAIFWAFRSLEEVHISMESRDFDDSDDNGGFGEPQEPQLFALANELHPKFYYEQFARTYFLGMCGVLKSNIPVKSLRIETNIDEVPLAPQVLEAPFELFSSEPLAVSLEELEIYTSIGEGVLGQFNILDQLKSWSKSIDDPVNSEAPTLSGLASHVYNLKYLCLHMNYLEINLSPSNPCPEFLGLLHSPRLESLIFNHFNVTASFLLSFFQRHPQLAYIELSDIKLVEGNWKEAFTLLESDMPSLKELRVGGLVGQDDKYLRIRPVQKTDDIFKNHRHWDRDKLGKSLIDRCCILGRADLQNGLEFA